MLSILSQIKDGYNHAARGPAMDIMKDVIGSLGHCISINHLQCLMLVDPAVVADRWRELWTREGGDLGDSAAQAAARVELGKVVAADCVTSQLPFSKLLMEAMPRLEMVVRQGVGFDNVDLGEPADL